MINSRLPLLAALALAGGLSACGSKDQAAEQTTPATVPTAGSGAPTPVAAAGVAVATPPAADATFDLSAVPVSTATLGAFPYVGKLQGYQLPNPSDSVDFEFDRTYVYDGQHIIPVEGRVLRRQYRSIDDRKQISELMKERNYENLVKTLGGVKVWSGKIPDAVVEKFGREEYHKHSGGIDSDKQTDTYLVRLPTKEIWIQLLPSAAGDTYYQLNVTERAAMPQRAAATSAAELKKN